jgi:L-fucose mutarotase
MISSRLTHPQTLAALAAAGHGSTVLISDGHYAAATAVNPREIVVHLNLEANHPKVTDVLDVVRASIPIESWTAMQPAGDALPCAVQEEARALIGADAPCRLVTRAEFYALARDPNLGLCIVTGDTRRFGNVLLTVGVDRSR